ncbi:MAG: cyanophycinase [Myxococcales bacterium]|nr:cyanophycinase [Myxococcales bacterium]
MSSQLYWVRVVVGWLCLSSLGCDSTLFSVEDGAASRHEIADLGNTMSTDLSSSTLDGSLGETVLTVFPRRGEASDDTHKPAGPGLLLAGGGADVDAAFVWARQRIAGSRPMAERSGDAVVLRASGADGYDEYLHQRAGFRSVQTALLPRESGPADFAIAVALVERAEFVFFAGGDQARYVAWQATPLLSAVASVYARGGVVGGTSAGCAILGQFVYDAVAAGSRSVTSRDALADPFDPAISFSRRVFSFAPLSSTITDTHFSARDRMGRLAAFVARQHADGVVRRSPPEVLGIGIDEGTALVIGPDGIGHLLRQGSSGSVHIVRAGPADRIFAGSPLVQRAIAVVRLERPGPDEDRFDFTTWTGTGARFTLSIDGASSSPYSPSDPYRTPRGSLHERSEAGTSR